MEGLRITNIKACNIKAIRELECKLGTVTIASGNNATGKSAFLNLFEIVFQRGHDADWILDPARLPIPPYPEECRKWKKPKSGKVEIELSNGSTITATVRAKTTIREIYSATGEKLGGSDEIRKLVTGIALDPGRFVHPTGSKAEQDKARLDFLLDVSPVDIPIDLIREFIPDILGPVDLARIDSHIEGFGAKRTTVNQRVTLLDKSIEQLEKALPEDDGTDWAAAAEEAQEKVTEAHSVLGGLAADRDVLIQSDRGNIKGNCQHEIDELKQQIVDVQADREKQLADSAARNRRLYEDEARVHEQILQNLRETLGTARERASAQERAAGVREQIANNRRDSASETAAAEGLTAQIEGLRDLRKDALADMPIEGLDIRAGKVYVDETPIEHLNDSDRLLIALQISTQGDNPLRFVFVENSESIEDERFRRAVDTLNEAGDVQVVFHRVSSAPELVVAGVAEQTAH